MLIVGVVFTVYYDAMYYSSGAFLLHKTEGAEAEDAQDSLLASRNVDVDPNICGGKRDSCQAFNQPVRFPSPHFLSWWERDNNAHVG